MDEILAKAKELLARKQEELQREQAELEQYLELRAKMAAKYGIDEKQEPAAASAPAPALELTAKKSSDERKSSLIPIDPRKPTKHLVSEAALHLIAESPSGYVRTKELYEAMRAMGIDIGGFDPQHTVTKLLSGDTRFESNRKLGWSLKK